MNSVIVLHLQPTASSTCLTDLLGFQTEYIVKINSCFCCQSLNCLLAWTNLEYLKRNKISPIGKFWKFCLFGFHFFIYLKIPVYVIEKGVNLNCFLTIESLKNTFLSFSELSASVPYRRMCEWRYESCANPCFKTCSDPEGTACKFLPL